MGAGDAAAAFVMPALDSTPYQNPTMTEHPRDSALIPHALMDAAPRSSRVAILAVYAVLTRLAQGGRSASIAQIGAISGVGRHSVRAAVHWLIAEGWASREGESGASPTYRTFPVLGGLGNG